MWNASTYLSNAPPSFFAKLTSVRYCNCLLKKPIINCRAKETPLNWTLTHHYSKEGSDKCGLYLHYLVLWYLGENTSITIPTLFHGATNAAIQASQNMHCLIRTSQRIRKNKIKNFMFFQQQWPVVLLAWQQRYPILFSLRASLFKSNIKQHLLLYIWIMKMSTAEQQAQGTSIKEQLLSKSQLWALH